MNNINVVVSKRTNVFAKKGYEYALNCEVNNKTWTLTTFDTMPDSSQLEHIVTLFERSIEIYIQMLKPSIQRPKLIIADKF